MLHNIRVVFFKEILDTIRDRRTVMSMIIIPLLAFPVIVIAFSAVLMAFLNKSQTQVQKVAVINSREAPEFVEMLKASGQVELVEVDSAEAALSRREIRAALFLPQNFKQRIMALDTSLVVTILRDKSESRSEFAIEKLKGLLDNYRRSLIASRLGEHELDITLVEPFRTEVRNVASKEKMGSYLLSLFLPYIILLLCMTGAMYTAMDLTAGEKERGTLETLLTSPIPRWQMAMGKLLTIITTSLVSSFLSIISMTITLTYSLAMGRSMAATSTSEMSLKISPLAALVMLLMMIPTATLFSATLMSISLGARTFKEAQSYVTPLVMVVILPAMTSFIPGIDLNFGLALIPLMNISLCIKEALLGNINWLYISVIFLSTALYAALAVLIAHRLFERESVLFGN